jgi:thioredoxin-related protein
VARKYYAQQIPYSIIIDKEGNIIYSHLGYMKGDEKKVRSIIEEQLKH